jgi:hypothetical protein
MEQRADRMIPGIDNIPSTQKIAAALKGAEPVDFPSLTNPKIADKMTRLLNKNKDQLANVIIDVPSSARKAVGGQRQLNLMEAVGSEQFSKYRAGGTDALMQMSPVQRQQALAGNVALQALEKDPTVLRQVTGSMEVGGKRLKGLRNVSRIGSLIRKSGTLKNAGKMVGGLASIIDPLFVGMQTSDIAKEMGLSKTQATAAGVGAAGLLGGGLLGAKSMMGSGAFTSSLGKAAGLGGGMAILTTGLDLYKSKLKSDREIGEQKESYMGNMDNIDFKGVDKAALLKAGGTVMGNDKLRKQSGMKSMMNNALLKTLLIGGGTAAAVLSGGTLLPMLGLAAAGMGAS